MRTNLLASLFAVVLVACGSPPDGAGGAGGAGGGGSGGGVGGGAGGGAGGGTGGGTGGGAGGGTGSALRFLGPTSPRRGPIELSFEVSEAAGTLSNFSLRLDGGAAATVWALERDGGALTVVWSSFDDVSLDTLAPLSLSATQAGAPISVGFGVALRNQPDTTRLIATAHRLQPLDGGGASSQGTGLSVCAWDGGAPGAVRRLVVGRGPSALAPAPHGRAFAVVEESAGTVSLVHTPLDADPGGVALSAPLSLPFGTVADAQFSRDGRALYVLGTQGPTMIQEATLWGFTLAEDLSSAGPARSLAVLARPPMKLRVDASSGRVLVAVGSGGTAGATPRLLWFEPDGTPAAAAYNFDFSVVNDLAIAPRGGLVLSTSDLFGDETFLYTLGAAGPTHVVTSAAVLVPFNVVFHPASTATAACALVTNLNRNTATPVLVTPTGITARPPLGPISLAAELDLVERGTLAGTAIVSAVNRLSRVQFQVNGTGSAPSTLIDLGPGTLQITGAVGVQR